MPVLWRRNCDCICKQRLAQAPAGDGYEREAARPSRDLLASRGVTSATVLCRVDGSDGLLTLPLQFVP